MGGRKKYVHIVGFLHNLARYVYTYSYMTMDGMPINGRTGEQSIMSLFLGNWHGARGATAVQDMKDRYIMAYTSIPGPAAALPTIGCCNAVAMLQNSRAVETA